MNHHPTQQPPANAIDQAQIPKLVHQIWYQGEAALPKKYRAYRISWISRHPDWEFRLWDAAMLRQHVNQHYPWFSGRYDNFPLDIQRIDASRYCILASLGGFYIDMDIECLRPIDSLLPNHDLILSRPHGFNNAMIGSAPGHRLWDAVLENLKQGRTAPLDDCPEKMKNSAAMQIAVTAGPRFFSMCVEESGTHQSPGTLICPGHYFESGIPGPGRQSGPGTIDDQAPFGRHDMDLNWLGAKDRLLSKIGRVPLAWLARLMARRQT
jgi:inositol phosphorylceramide mannosyltransferase catalytic subunit